MAQPDQGAGRQVRAVLGMWTFIAGEILFFGALFMCFLVYRHAYRDAFAAGSGQLEGMLGGINTLILLTSSLLMACAVQLAEAGRRSQARWLLSATALLGIAFLFVKALEYGHEIEKGLAPWYPGNFSGRPALELYFSFYFTMTGLHALHLLAGIVAVLVMTVCLRREDGHIQPALRATGLYWHFVDVVWVFLFPLLYLIR